MVARRIGRALRFVAPAVAVAAVAAAGVLPAPPARAAESCDDAAAGTGVTVGEVALPCPETSTTTGPGEEPPPTETAPGDPAAPTVTTPTTPSAPVPAPPRVTTTTTTTTATAPSQAPVTTTPASSGGGIFGSGARIARPPQSGTPKLSGGPYVFPVIGPSSFTDTWGAARATVAWHHGVDIFAPLGTPLVAVADGTLFSVGWNAIGGRRLWLRDRQGNYFYYAHLSAFSPVAVEGARVTVGTVIGYLGNTGDAVGTPYHLHFEIHPVSLLYMGYDGAVNPFPYVSSWHRLDRLDDISLVEGLRWAIGDEAIGPAAAAAAAAPPSAPPPGAVLLGYTDISSADELSPGSLGEALDERPTLEEITVAAAPAPEPEQPPAASPPDQIAMPPSPEEDARIARALDSEATRPARYAPGVWDALAMCESGGDWGANTGNGYVGGLQFHPQTWTSHGGGEFAESPDLATREQQIAVAERVLESQGWRAWPACSAMLGLRSLARSEG